MLKKLKSQYLEAKQAYYNKKPIMSDARFDALEDRIRAANPNWKELSKTGVRVASKKTEVALTQPMPSLNKVYPEALPKWVAKNATVGPDRYIVMDKLDGSALQLVYQNGGLRQVITRGDGLLGGDITFLAEWLNIPKRLHLNSPNMVLRCEAVMRKDVFASKWVQSFEDARSMVNGVLNRRTPHPSLADIDIVVVGVYGFTITAGLKVAKAQGFQTVANTMLSASDLAQHLAQRKSSGAYAIDGLVVAHPNFGLNYTTNDKPRRGIVAFKINAEADAVTVRVKSIIWQVSGRGRIIPKICIEPTQISGVTVQHATAHNAVWMVTRSIGPGAVVKLIRSGGVIPKIVGVIKPGRSQPPDIRHKVEGDHYVVDRPSAATADGIEVKNIVKFMKTLGIDLLADKTVALLLPVLPTALAYVEAWHNSRLDHKLLGILGAKTAANISAEVDRVFSAPVSLRTLMVASQIFGVGIGDRKLELLERARVSMNSLLQPNFNKARLLKVPGYSKVTADLLWSGIEEMREFVAVTGQMLTLNGTLPKTYAPKTGVLTGQYVSFTSYRDKDHEAQVQSRGAVIVPYGAKTTILLYKEGGKASSKVQDAQARGLKVCTFAALKTFEILENNRYFTGKTTKTT